MTTSKTIGEEITKVFKVWEHVNDTALYKAYAASDVDEIDGPVGCDVVGFDYTNISLESYLAWSEYFGVDPFTNKFKEDFPDIYAEFYENLHGKSWEEACREEILDVLTQEAQDSGEYDPVNSPNHYQLKGGLQSIDMIEAVLPEPMFRGFLWGNVLKYMNRWHLKNGVEDLKKAEWYRKKLEERVESDDE